jgi:hypothetical protein
VNGLVNTLHMLERAIVSERSPRMVRVDRSNIVDAFPQPGIATKLG